MTMTDLDVADHHAAGSLADELPYWGWLPDDRTCLTRRGELVTLARLTPTVVDGHTPEQLDAPTACRQVSASAREPSGPTGWSARFQDICQ